MPFNGSGTYTVVYNFTTEAASPPIEIAKLDDQFTDMATALSNCILRDGTGLPTATIDWNTQRITNLGNSTTTTGPTTISQFQSNAPRTLGSVAGTNTITGNLTPALTAYTAGMGVYFVPANNSTGAATININSLGAKSIVKGDGTALESGDLQASTVHFIVYDGTNFVLINPLSFTLVNGTLTGNFTCNGTLTTDNTTADEVGFKGMPKNTQSGAGYTCVLADAGKFIYCAGSFTYTIPANASVAFPIGTVLTFVNSSGATSCSIAITSDTLTFASVGTTGTRTLGGLGIATAIKINSTEWLISGTGLS